MASGKRDFGYYVASFLGDYLRSKKGCSEKTVESYRDALVLFIEFVCPDPARRLDFDDVDREVLEAFLDHLERDRGNSVSTRNQRQAALNSFFSFVRTREPSMYAKLTEMIEIPRKKSDRPVIAYLTVAETEALFESIDDGEKDGLRDKAALAFLYETAARVGEMTGCLACQLRLDGAPYVELHGKGGKARNVPVTGSFAGLMSDYMDAFGIGGGPEPLFFNRYGQPLSEKGVTYILRKRLAVAARDVPSIGRKHLTCHSLRHSRAMHLVEAKVNLIHIRDIMGHASVTTTEIYAKENPEAMREVVERNSMAYGNDVRYTPGEKDDLVKWLKENF